MRALGPHFDQPVAPGGYVWWYLDALSDDGHHGLTIIAMLGSVFSPYYAWARRRQGAEAVDPLNHCGLNVALYGRGGKRWSLTERGRAALSRDASHLAIGPSRLHWDQDALVIDIKERGMPIPHRLLGRVRLYPEALADYQAFLDPAARHRWVPIAPRARVHVEMAAPALRWSGPAYFDSNAGDEPLENAFDGWDWSRAPHGGGTSVLYHVIPRPARDGRLGTKADADSGTAAHRGAAGDPQRGPSGKGADQGATARDDADPGATPTDGTTNGGARLALHFARDGAVRPLAPLEPRELPATRIWRIPRATRADAAGQARILETLEDTPFYARSVVATRLEGEAVTGVHESLSLERFRQRWVQMLLPFRMPRVSK